MHCLSYEKLSNDDLGVIGDEIKWNSDMQKLCQQNLKNIEKLLQVN